MPFEPDRLLRRIDAMQDVLSLSEIKSVRVDIPPKIDDFEPTTRITVRCWYKGKLQGTDVRFINYADTDKEQVLLHGFTWMLLSQDRYAHKQINKADWLVRKYGDYPLHVLLWKEWKLGLKMKIWRLFHRS